ncbi:MAG: VCBS domain-containing protein [Prevotellaceae bacterium]|jgi:hypothetical protein|nr:VCBS domain-containing protein [Prevotellaceae bacterium]
MKKFVTFSMMVCLAGLFFACDDKNNEEAPYFGIKAEFLTQNFGSAAGDNYVTVRTNQAFTATSSEAWCIPEILDNKVEENLKISVVASDDVNPRTATVTVACENFSSISITVTQDGVQVSLDVTPLQPEPIAENGGNIAFTVTASSAWTYSIPESVTWLRENAKTDAALTLTVSANPDEAPRDAMVTFFLANYPSVSQTVTVSQEIFQPVLNITPPATPVAKTGGNITFTINANANWQYSIDNATWLTEGAKNTTSLTLTAANNTLWSGRKTIVTISLTDYPQYIDSFSVGQSGAADMLDVIFNPDGSATDVSPMQHAVNLVTNASYPLSVATNATYGRNAVTFNPRENGSNDGSYYRIDYANNNEFDNKLTDGHSFECLVKFDTDYSTPQNYETKFFTTHEGGGTGFMIANQNGTGGPNGITFLPNISTADGGGSNWIWANSQIKPDGTKYYHLVGVWNKTEGKAYIYVDGELKKEISAAGFYRKPNTAACYWVCIGGDAGTGGGSNLFDGEMVIARIYDIPLTADDAAALYKEIQNP